MQREKNISHKIAILATGDEVCAGDIINSNSQEIALRLSVQGMHIRMHMAAPDTINEIEKAIQFLLDTHDALIITGGLGPTSDDLTRYALANAINRPLNFDTDTWNAICVRLQRFGYQSPPESNRQQAFFPEGASIIPNPNGTAAGCIVELNNQRIYMLPGPPGECLPMLDNVVIDSLKLADFQHVGFHEKWLLFGVSEGMIAEKLDALVKPYHCTTGYRLCYPYIEFKLHGNEKKEFMHVAQIVKSTIQPYLIDNGKFIASELLKKILSETNCFLDIHDHATGGLLEATIKTPKTFSYVSFSEEKTSSLNHLRIKILGLKEFWENKKNCTNTHLEIKFNEAKAITIDLPFRDQRVKQYAVEFICQQILPILTQKGY